MTAQQNGQHRSHRAAAGSGAVRASATTAQGSPPGQTTDDATAADAPRPASYEQARDQLAEIVATLEEGGLSLDESLALWERGQALAATCETFLAGARERVQAVLSADEQGSTTAH